MYEVGWARPPARGDVSGVCGLRKTRASGELGADDGVSGRVGYKRVEWVEARDDGRDIGRRVGVRKRKGTPATSSRCLCIRSKTFCSS